MFYGTLTAGMALLVIARNSILFLFGWEIMALSAFFLVTTEDHEKEVREAGWLYLVAAHAATLCLFALFALLHAASGSFALGSVEPGEPCRPAWRRRSSFSLWSGFGLKAGIMPLHVWLPSAHAIAPSHVSAIMSGVLIKMGIYGLVRVTSLLPHPPLAWGVIVLGLGVVSGVLGVAFAIGQHDLKRLLAYHSIENIGIIVMGLGLALIGRSLGRADWVVLGLGGSLAARLEPRAVQGPAVLECRLGHPRRPHPRDRPPGRPGEGDAVDLPLFPGRGGRDLWPAAAERLRQRVPDLPRPVRHAREWRAEPSFAGAAFAAPALALIGALAVACFVKVYGAVFLGTARSEHARHAHESPPSMLGPMGVLVACCFLIGLAPLLIAPDSPARQSRPGHPNLKDAGPRLATLAPLGWITVMGLLLIVALLLGGARAVDAAASQCCGAGATWGCGYVAPTPRMQYTSSSFAQMLVGMFGWVLRPRTHRPEDLPLFPPEDRFPQRGARHGARRSRAADVPFRGMAVLLVPGVPAGKHPDLLAVHLPRPDCPAALALGGT